MDESLNRPVESVETDVVAETEARTLVQPNLWGKPSETWEGNQGEVTTSPASKRITDWDDILRTLGYPTDEFEIVEPVKVSAWDQTNKDGTTEQLWSYKAGIRRRVTPVTVPYDDLVKEIKRYKPVAMRDNKEGTTLVVNVADTQFAKADGDGLEGTIKRFLDANAKLGKYLEALLATGTKISRILVVGLGDIIEGCNGNYNAQQFTVEVNLRQQLRIARRLIRDLIINLSKYGIPMTVSAVPGNHGEERLNGRLYTTTGDNHDVAVFEVLADVFAANPEAFGHVEFRLPEDEIYVMFDCGGTKVAFTHGHITKGGGNAQSKIKSWWQDQAFGNQPVGHADILVTGHYHHTSVIQYGKKCHIQCPSLDGGSEWWTNLSGDESPPGLLVFTVDGNGWDNLKVIL